MDGLGWANLGEEVACRLPKSSSCSSS
uniref:Uncharacterized protein n=1 Tax=Arundo donax TaxID=35708 RepID=A0A0A9E962_ARUDO